MNSTRTCADSQALGPRLNVEIVASWMAAFEDLIEQSETVLTELDRAIGDGDHGVNMRRGMKAVMKGLRTSPPPPDVASRLRAISELLTSSVGGASGPLYGAFFLHGSRVVPRKTELTLNDLSLLVEAGCQGVIQLGKASVGDKTMVDTLSAAAGSLRASQGRREALPAALSSAVQAAGRAAEGTIPMVARRGRASYLGDRSAGFEDPGAASAHLLFKALSSAFSLPSRF